MEGRGAGGERVSWTGVRFRGAATSKRKAGGRDCFFCLLGGENVGTAAGAGAGGELDDRMVIEWLRATPNATTRECIQHFARYLTDDAKKGRFTALVKEVAQLSGGVLLLRPAYRGTAPTSPAPAPAAA